MEVEATSTQQIASLAEIYLSGQVSAQDFKVFEEELITQTQEIVGQECKF